MRRDSNEGKAEKGGPPRRLPHMRDFKGQVTVELILLMAVFVLIGQIFMNTIKSKGALDQFSKTPNRAIGHMLSNGNWKWDQPGFCRGSSQRYGRRFSRNADDRPP